MSLKGRLLVTSMAATVAFSCSDSEGPLAPYAGGGRPLSTLTIEENSFRPEITWVGGYASIVGINKGSAAVLDSSLIWAVSIAENNLRFPATFGVLPAGGQDLTASVGGTTPDSLSEDSTYTFWVLKEGARGTVMANAGLILREDSLGSESGSVVGDTVFIGPKSFLKITVPLDVFINIDDVRTLGPLATIEVKASNIDNHPRISWQMRTPGADSLAAALGIVTGLQYSVNNLVWEVLSIDSSAGQVVYRDTNVVASPIVGGQQFPATEIFTAYPAAGLQRGQYYFFWIANKDWDGIGHQRFSANHAYATFRVW